MIKMSKLLSIVDKLISIAISNFDPQYIYEIVIEYLIKNQKYLV